MKRLLIAVAAIALALYAQSWLNWLYPVNSHPLEAAIFYTVAVVLFVALFRKDAEPFVIGIAERVTRRGLLNAALASAGVAVVLAGIAAPRFASATPGAGGWTLHLASAAAILLAALLFHLSQRPLDAPELSFAERWRGWWGKWWGKWWLPTLALLALTIAAAVMRLYKLEMLPEGIWYDEAVNALIARQMRAEPGYTPFYLAETFHTAHHNYLVALAFTLFGESIGSARLVSAVAGILLVPAGWLLGWEFFQTRPAHGRQQSRTGSTVPLLMAFALAALLAFVPWSLNLSRIAVNYLFTPLFVVLATALLLRGLRTQSILAYAGSGFALAAGLMGYTSFRLFAPVLPLFVAAVLMYRRDAWRTCWQGLLTLTLVATIVAAPLLSFAVTNRDEFMQRASDVSLFKDKPAEEHRDLLIENVRSHLLMFNVRGDANGRHNLPGRPILDPALGALFVLGVGLSLWRWRHPLHWLLLIWFAFTLLGGILSLGFEAPQSLRSNGALPAALLLALVPIAEVLRLWERSEGGAYYPRALPGVAVLLLVPLLYWNWNAFFREQMHDFAVWNSFSTGETIVARKLAELAPETNDVWLMSGFQRRGDIHPTQRFLAPQWAGKTRTLHAWESPPYIWSPEKDAWLFYDFDTELPFNTLRSFYPGGDYGEMKPNFSDSIAGRFAHLTPEVHGASQGVVLTWFSADGLPIETVRIPQIELSLPTAAPAGSARGEIEGILRVLEYGDYRFALTAPTQTELWLDESTLLSGAGDHATTLPLATGNHLLRLEFDLPAASTESDSPLTLAWARPATKDELIPAAVLFSDPVTAHGLLGIYRAGGEATEGEVERAPLLAAIDQQINTIFHSTPIPRPFHVEWTGKLAAPLEGVYRFTANGIDAVTLEIDGEPIVAGGHPGVQTEVSLPLAAGLHDIRVLLSAAEPYTRVFVEWAPPGMDFSPIPSTALFPPRGSYAGVAMPALALPAAAVSAPASSTEAFTPSGGVLIGPLLDTPVNIIASGLDHPVGIAVNSGVVWVADSAQGVVMLYDDTGGLSRRIDRGDAPLVEPFDLALAPDGTVIISDAAAPALYRFDANGDFIERIQTDATLIDRVRGIDIAADGSILLAQTPGQQIVRLEADGTLRSIWSALPNADAQPVDVVAADGEGAIAALLGADLLVHYNAAGEIVGAVPLATANSQDAPHLAIASSGDHFLTQPEEGRILWHNPAGEVVGYWDLRTAHPTIKPVGIAVERTEDGATRLWFTDAEEGIIGWVPAPALNDRG